MTLIFTDAFLIRNNHTGNFMNISGRASIEMKSEGYTYRYDFEPVPSNEETFNPDITVPVEARSDAGQCLDICLDMLRSIFGKEKVNRALQVLSELDY